MVCRSASKGYVFTIHDWCWCGVVVEVESAGLRHCSLYSPGDKCCVTPQLLLSADSCSVKTVIMAAA